MPDDARLYPYAPQRPEFIRCIVHGKSPTVTDHRNHVRCAYCAGEGRKHDDRF